MFYLFCLVHRFRKNLNRNDETFGRANARIHITVSRRSAISRIKTIIDNHDCTPWRILFERGLELFKINLFCFINDKTATHKVKQPADITALPGDFLLRSVSFL